MYLFYTPKNNAHIQHMNREIMSFFHVYASDLLAGKRERNPDGFESLSYMMIPGTYAEMHQDYD